MCVRKTSHVEFFNGQEKNLNEREGAKVLREIELSENSAGILELDNLQDIPEDDDMIIFE